MHSPDLHSTTRTGLKTPRTDTISTGNKMSDFTLSIQDDGKYNFDPSKLAFREPKVMSSGAKFVSLSYGGNDLMIETPTLRAPFGKQEFENPGAATKHSIMLAFDDMESRPDVKEFHSLITTIDALIRKTGFEKSMSWFRKKYIVDTVNDMYTPLERKSKDKVTGEEDGRWPPSVKLTLPFSAEGRPKFFTYNPRQEEIDISTIDMRHAQVTAIVTLSNVWMAGNMFGVSFKAYQLLVQPKQVMAKCAFRNVRAVESLPAPPAGGMGGGLAGGLAGASTAHPDLVDSSEDEADVPLGDE